MEIFPRTFILKFWASKKLLVLAENVLRVYSMVIECSLPISLSCTARVTTGMWGNWGFCTHTSWNAPCSGEPEIFIPLFPPEKWGLDVSAGAGFGPGESRTFYDWESWVVKVLSLASPTSLSLRSNRRCLWLAGGFHWGVFGLKSQKRPHALLSGQLLTKMEPKSMAGTSSISPK